MTTRSLALADLAGTDLGTRVTCCQERDAILYALAVGATADRLDLVYERELRVLPTYANALGLWAVQTAGALGAYDPQRSLHASQRLRMLQPLAPAGEIAMSGRIANVWDKGKAALLEIEVCSEQFVVRYDIFLPGLGGWGGERGPSAASRELQPSFHVGCTTDRERAALYRLTGDRHPIHIDPEIARANGFERPILHGLCTLGIAAREVAAAVGAHPADLRDLDARLVAPVLPGATIEIAAQDCGQRTADFEAHVGQTLVIAQGRAAFVE